MLQPSEKVYATLKKKTKQQQKKNIKVYWKKPPIYMYFIVKCIWQCIESLLSVAWPTGVQLLVFFCSSVPVVLFDTPEFSRCRSQHVVSVESSSLFHHSICPWFICFPWWSINELETLHVDRTTNYMFWAITEAEGEVGIS